MGKEREQITPILRQYYDLKEKHPDAILLFRSGDFYEAFEEDAKVCSNILGITLTRKSEDVRSNDPNKGYQAMFPHHALDIYLPVLIRAGKRVAICDQIELPKKELKKKSIKDML